MWAEAGRAPPFEDLFRHQSDGLGVLPNSNVGVVGASADGGEGESSWPMEAEWPEEWSTPSEREHVLAVDFDITVAVSTTTHAPQVRMQITKSPCRTGSSPSSFTALPPHSQLSSSFAAPS